MFFNKKKGPETPQVRAVYYIGLPGFNQNFACDLIKENDLLIIRQVKPQAQASMSLSQIQSIDVIPENDFMTRYQHTNAPAPKDQSGFWKMYMVINYIGSDGLQKMIAFWVSNLEISKLNNFVAAIQENSPVQNYVL